MSRGATENARPDIARPDNAASDRRDGHREACFNVRVSVHCFFVTMNVIRTVGISLS